jgi:hypothetical protein
VRFRVTMKDPDTLGDAIRQAAQTECNELGLAADEEAAVFECRAQEALEACKRWFSYSEYLTVEVDTSAGTCVVVEAKR